MCRPVVPRLLLLRRWARLSPPLLLRCLLLLPSQPLCRGLFAWDFAAPALAPGPPVEGTRREGYGIDPELKLCSAAPRPSRLLLRRLPLPLLLRLLPERARKSRKAKVAKFACTHRCVGVGARGGGVQRPDAERRNRT